MSPNVFEESVASKFRLKQAPTVLAQRAAVAPIAFTRLCNHGEFRGRTTPVPPDDAFTFQVALTQMSPGEIWVDGRHSTLRAAPGDTFVFDLTTNPVANLPPPYDFLRFYLSSATLDELAYERGVRRVGGLRATHVGINDRVMHGLALSILPALEDPASATTLFLDSVALAFHAHAMYAYGGVLGSESSIRSGLAPWQLRRAYQFIEAHLDGNPSLSEIARECRLSPAHFARAFRRTTGLPPHRWLITRRVERAKELLLRGDLDLAHIALACGFVDQSHLTRIFARYEGRTPGQWRRLRRN